uniref:Uncharacterized protein n=1 Tax=Cacopsylla melanoneura TaxID=428564 RepID=A0A8D8SE41_9HEMI
MYLILDPEISSFESIPVSEIQYEDASIHASTFIFMKESIPQCTRFRGIDSLKYSILPSLKISIINGVQVVIAKTTYLVPSSIFRLAQETNRFRSYHSDN